MIFHSASTMMPLLIFDLPIARSVNVIGTSTSRNPLLHGAPGEVDLEAVAGRLDLVQR